MQKVSFISNINLDPAKWEKSYENMQDRAGGFLKRIMDAPIDLPNVDKMEAEYNLKKELKKNMSRVSVLKGDDSFSVGTRLFRDQSGMTLASYNSLMQPPTKIS